MPNSIEIELEGSTKKFISVGNQTFLNSKGQTEVCRKGLKGQHCQRHHGGAITSFSNARAQLDAYAERTAQKLSPFENGCVWLYSLLMRIPIEEARQRYINSTAMYTLIGVSTPNINEVKGLQKILLKLADISQVTSTRMDSLKRLIKKMTVGNGFSEAGFYSLKDMVKDSAMKLKLGVAGTTLGGTLFLTGCSNTLVPSEINNTLDISSADSVKLGDTAQLLDNGIITDELGSYQRTKIDPSKIKITSNNTTLSKADAESAKNFAIDFVASEVLDSIALDNPSQLDKWYTEVAPQYMHSGYMNDIVKASKDATSYNTSVNSLGIILSNAQSADGSSFIPELMRDGKPRIANKSFGSQVELKSGPIPGSVEVYLRGTATYFADETKIYDTTVKNMIANQSMIDANGNPILDMDIARQELKGMYPELEDGKPQAASVLYEFSYTLVKENGSWKIAGYSGSIMPAGDRYMENASQDELNLRDKVK